MSFRFTVQQKKAIEAPLGAVLVVAGPGAGKTACLIARIGHVVTRLNIPAGRILAVTFTNKAAEEIAARLESALRSGASEIRGGTIHALCADILREFPAEAGLQPGFGIADDDYQRTLLRQMRQGQRSGQLIGLFSKRRLMGYTLTPGDEQLYRDYQRTLRRRNLVDFDDLVVMTQELFASHADIADAVSRRWDYVLVDEFQDVNPAQYAILRRLAEPHGNIMAVGDDEQSIFSWTGADPEVLKLFERHYGIAEPILLDKNHRTSHQIFGVARRLLLGNTPLFQKPLTATRLSTFEVRAVAFADDDAEATWIINDIKADRDASAVPGPQLQWGEYAVLYRRHEVGNRLEAAFLKAGLPCRLAKGRPLSDDPVIGYVIQALRLVLDPRDPSAAEAFARRVLPPHLFERIEQNIRSAEDDFLLTVRDLAGAMHNDPDGKKLWRLIYQAENLAAMRPKHTSLRSLIEELLSQRVGIYTNRLEEHHEDLSDPADLPHAVALAAKLGAAQKLKSRIVLEPMNGLDIALRGLLFGAGFKLSLYADEVVQAELDDLRIGPADAGPDGLAFTVFKALQLLHGSGLSGAPPRYVTFDLETTDVDPATCEIVEIAAVRVENGQTVAEFRELVKPGVPIAPGAQRQHGYSDADVATAPTFADVWPRFKEFVGADPMVAHNGQDFDVPVLRRMAAAIGDTRPIVAYDTLPLARSLDSGNAKLTSLAERYGIEVGRAHHALDDAKMLVGVYEALEKKRVVRARKSSLVNILGYVGLAFAVDGGRRDTDEVDLLYWRIARYAALGRFTDCLEYYEAGRARPGAHGPSIEEVIERLGGRKALEQIRTEKEASSRYPEAVARLEALIDQQPGESLEDATRRFLERVALSASHGADVESHRVNLLTLHSTKGLEFSRVYIVGVEDDSMPGWIARDEKNPENVMQEARRLLYVGMTRAIERLVLTRVDRRNGKPGGASQFLDEMGLDVQRADAALTAAPAP